MDKEKIANFEFTNSIVDAGEREITSNGRPTSCAIHPEKQGPAGVMKSCFSSINFTHNAMMSRLGGWPSGNFFPENPAAIGFVNYNNGKGGDYRLCKGKDEPAGCKAPSPYLRAGTDGKSLGADIDAIEAATAGAL
jgi:hypothetical protein